jgi:hypothetical protein
VRNPIRVLFAVTVLACLLALLLMPGDTTAMVVQSHASGKQSVRIISLLSLLVLAAVICREMMRVPTITFHGFRQVYAHGFGPDLLDKTCVRLC